MKSTLSILLLTATFAFGQAKDDNTSAAEVRNAIQRGLPLLEKFGSTWIAERKCNSCHVVSFMIWGHNEAKVAGAKVDANKLDEWNNWALDYSVAARQWFKLTDASQKQLQEDGVPEAIVAKLKPMLNQSFIDEPRYLDSIRKVLKADEVDPHKALLVKRAALPRTGEKNDGGSMATMGQLLLGHAGVKGASLDAFLEAAPAVLRSWQEANGSWKAGGQLPSQNRTGAESDEVVTGWNILGMSTFDKRDAPTQKSMDAALAWFRKAKPGKTLETLLVHLLVEDKLGKPDDAGKFLKDVLSKQNADGGWGWALGAESDAFATGQTLYALSAMKTKCDPTVIDKARKYLLKSQTTDGHWVVPPKAITNPKSTDARVAKLVPIYNFWGTAWATIGLSRSVSASK